MENCRVPDDIGGQLTIPALEWSCLWTLSDDNFLHCLSLFEYTIFLFLIFLLFIFCLLLLFTVKCKLIDAYFENFDLAQSPYFQDRVTEAQGNWE